MLECLITKTLKVAAQRRDILKGCCAGLFGYLAEPGRFGIAYRNIDGQRPPFNAEVNIEEFGGKGDGSSDNLSAIDDAQRYCAGSGGGSIFYPPGEYCISRAIQCRSNVSHYGAGLSTTIRLSTDKNIRNALQNVFIVGCHSVNMIKHYDKYSIVGSDANPYILLLEDGSSVSDMEVVIVCSMGHYLPKSGVAIPDEMQYNRVVGRYKSNGIITQWPMRENFKPNYVLKLSGFNSFLQRKAEIAQNVRIENMRLENGGIWHSGAINCSVQDIEIKDARNLLIANGVAYSHFSRIEGSFRNRFLEIKLGSHDCHIQNIHGVGEPFDKASLPGAISLGESCRDIEVSDFELRCIGEVQGDLIGLKCAKNITIRSGSIDALRAKGPCVGLYAIPDSKCKTSDNVIANVRFATDAAATPLRVSKDVGELVAGNQLMSCNFVNIAAPAGGLKVENIAVTAATWKE